MWCDTEYLARAEPLRRAGLSAAAETRVTTDGRIESWIFFIDLIDIELSQL